MPDPKTTKPVIASYRFPSGFLWGTVTGAYQVEGDGSNSSWGAWEGQEGRIVGGQKAGLACDWWNGRWREDFDRAAETYQNAHRMSVEWSRIQPSPTVWDEQALDRYRSMARGLRERNMIPVVTLHHFNNPLWLEEQGGWENPETPGRFAAFARRVAEALKAFVSMWVTFNEPNTYAHRGYLLGEWPPGKTSLDTTIQVLANLARGHAAAYRAIHAVQPQAQVGVAHAYRVFRPAHAWNPLDRSATRWINQIYNEIIPTTLYDGRLNAGTRRLAIPEAARTQDFIGLN